MPKMKTHRGLAKRVKMTGSGKLKRSHAFTSHRFHGLRDPCPEQPESGKD